MWTLAIFRKRKSFKNINLEMFCGMNKKQKGENEGMEEIQCELIRINE